MLFTGVGVANSADADTQLAPLALELSSLPLSPWRSEGGLPWETRGDKRRKGQHREGDVHPQGGLPGESNGNEHGRAF